MVNGSGPSSEVEHGLPVNWELARRTAARLVPAGPAVSRAEAEELVDRLRSDAAVAEGHVREVTGLGAGLPLLPADVVDRPAWAAAAVDGMAALTAGARLPRTPRLARSLTGTTAGLQVGTVLAYLGGRVLGQYDPFGGASGGGRLLLVAPNVHAAQRVLNVSATDFGLWVCLHEATHRLQFTAVPWLRDYFAGEIGRFLSVADSAGGGLLQRLPEALRGLREARGDSLALVELLQGPEQRAVLDRLLAVTTLLEGHADHVMDAAGPEVVPSVATIRARFTARRRGGGLADRILRALLGVEAKVRQYAVGSAFTKAVVDEVGMHGLNRVWTSPETLPSRAELADPQAWLRRVG
ncbi:zinc-dependent metalloprotease [Pseudonocardia acidicola]|uniref:Zinc-dependent metalloprotease n=1 Tax=Pseudonocardia acidicola TaxID=2724939 RepID=A0ABX1SG64_9PSEU|nr:zinc-dependent metalloprotease [Pseudonocardia acidicola]NMH99244.1 zinc-dependent metalloprotease [Pseudonocardia acidicola]